MSYNKTPKIVQFPKFLYTYYTSTEAPDPTNAIEFHGWERIKCDHCGQYGEPGTACKHCGAPIGDEDDE